MGKWLRGLVIGLLLAGTSPAWAAPRGVPIALASDDVIATGNDWLALPSIRARDGALDNFNVLSMRYRGLLETAGPKDRPLIAPFIEIDGVRRPFANLSWSLRGYWIPTATMAAEGIEASLTWVTPSDNRAAVLHLRLVNRANHPIKAGLGIDAAWGAMNRVTYAPTPLGGSRSVHQAPWDRNIEVFAYSADDTTFTWGLGYGQAQAELRRSGEAPGLTARKGADLAPGEAIEADFILAAGIEEYGVGKTGTVVANTIDRLGIEGVIARAEADALRRTRSTGQPALDLVMNRNYLFTSYYAWGRTIDSDQLVGVTSRSNRYYVSAAYWDRDAMIWSFPALLDTDPARAREALDHALGVQGRNTGIHSRYIDGVVLEDGFQLDELVAPLIALASYVEKTGDMALLARHGEMIASIRARLDARRDSISGLYETFQDSQDEYIKKPFQIYDNALTWKALGDLARLDARRGDRAGAARMRSAADALKAAILRHGIGTPPGGTGPVFASAVDARGGADFADVPPGSLVKLPALGFIAEDDPLFQRTYAWLHGAYPWSYAGKAYGLPGSYRLPFTTSWGVADHLMLNTGRDQARKILLASPWDGGIITEGVNPDTAIPDKAGLAFATAAGYVSHAICAVYCTDGK